jgi:hypothetical protein
MIVDLRVLKQKSLTEAEKKSTNSLDNSDSDEKVSAQNATNVHATIGTD